MHTYRVADWMSTPALTIPSTTTLAAAQQLMDDEGVRRLPVVDRGRLVGIVSKGDLRAAQPSAATTLSVFEWRTLLDRVSVAECMRRGPISIGPAEPVLRAAQQMLTYKVSGLPVVVRDQVVGVITESDLFRLLIADLSGALEPDDPRVAVRCPQCGTSLRRRAGCPIDPAERCWSCHGLLRPDSVVRLT